MSDPVSALADDKGAVREFFTQFQYAISRNAQEQFFVEQRIKEQQDKGLPPKKEDLEQQEGLQRFERALILTRFPRGIGADDPAGKIVESHPHHREALEHVAQAWAKNERAYMQRFMEIQHADQNTQLQVARVYKDKQQKITDLATEHFLWVEEWQARTLAEQQKGGGDGKEIPPWATEYVQHYRQFIASLKNFDKQEHALLEHIENAGVPVADKERPPAPYALTPAPGKLTEIGRKPEDPQGLSRILQEGVVLKNVDSNAALVLQVNAKTGTVSVDPFDSAPAQGERQINTLGARLGILVRADAAKQKHTWAGHDEKGDFISVPGRGMIRSNVPIDFILVDDKGKAVRKLPATAALSGDAPSKKNPDPRAPESGMKNAPVSPQFPEEAYPDHGLGVKASASVQGRTNPK